MVEQALYLAIDQGGQSTRAIVFDAQGQVHGAEQVVLSTQRSEENRVEHDPDELLESMHKATATVLKQFSPGRIVAAGLATQRSTIVCWDRETGTALSPIISWQDTRATEILSRCAPSNADIRRITGLVRSPHYGASKLRWCLENIPAVDSARKAGTLAMGPLSSFLLFHLLQDRPLLADPVNASRTLLWDITALDWSDELLQAFSIPVETLPVCVANRHDFGLLNGTGIPLTVCTGDQNAAIFAGGPVAQGTAYINIGTGAFVLARSDRVPDNTRLLRSVTWSSDSGVTRILEGTVNGAGSALAQMQASAGEIETAATNIGQAGKPLFLNGVSGLASPYWREDFESRFVGSADRGQQLSAVLESILFLLQVNLGQIARHSHLQAIVISGGLARNTGVCQGLADLSGLTVHRSEEAEATARGLAFLTAGLPDTWCQSSRQTFIPSEDNGTLRWRYSTWLEEMTNALAA